MNHPDENHEFFEHLEAEMNTDRPGEVVDLDKARSARAGSADRTAIESADPTADESAVRTVDPSADEDDEESGDSKAPRPADPSTLPGPGITTFKRKPILPSWLKSKPGFVSTTQRATSNALYATLFHGIRTPGT